MLLKEKINLVRYLVGSIIPIIVLVPILKSASEWIGIVILMLGIWINQYFHILGAEALLNNASSQKKSLSLLSVLGKTIILAISVIISIQFLQKKLFIAVIIYLYMLMIFSISLRIDVKRNEDV